MDDGGSIAVLGQFVAAIVVSVVGLRVTWMGRGDATWRQPLLGLGLASIGIGNVILFLPVLRSGGSLEDIGVYAATGRTLFGVSVVAIAAFNWLAFRPRVMWAKALVLTIIVVLSAVLSGSIAQGYMLAERPSVNPWFWPEMVISLVPYLWSSIEAGIQHAKARRRLRLGISDPIVCNRFLLWGLFGASQAASVLLAVLAYMHLEQSGSLPMWLDQTMGAMLWIGAISVWLAFSPPQAYRRWVMGSADPAAAAEEV